MSVICRCLVVVLVVVAGSDGCGRQSPTPAPPAVAQVVEEPLAANTVNTQQGGNAWSTGGGIDWTHVGPGGQNSGSSSGGSGISNANNNNNNRGNNNSNNRGPSSSGSRRSVTPNDLRRLSEELFSLDTNSVGDQITLNKQGRTSSSNNADMAPQPLFAPLSPHTLRGPTIAALWALLDNYTPRVTAGETDTQSEKTEQQTFLNTVMNTPIMERTEQFLKDKGLITRALREVLQEIWFTPYPRSRRTLGSSGFEHVFVGELKGGKVSGFHNWVSFYKEEQEGDLDYFGYMKTIDLGQKGQLILLKFDWTDDSKPVGSMFVGTSPELDMALYTICFLARQGNNCPMSLNNKRFNIKTYSQSYNSKKLIGTAYPNI